VTHFDYQASKAVVAQDYPFYALIMAAMRQADTRNMTMLEEAWPEVADELRARYHAPGGLLAGEEYRSERERAEREQDAATAAGAVTSALTGTETT
jgi:hypothetical protein